MDSRKYSLAFRNFLSRFMDDEFQRFADSYTDPLLNQPGIDLESNGSSAVHPLLKAKHRLENTARESSTKRNCGGYVDTENFPSSTSAQARKFCQNKSYLPEPVFNLAHWSPSSNDSLKSLEKPKSVLCRKSSHHTQINHYANQDSSETRDTGAVLKKGKFCKVREEKVINADSRTKDFKAEVSREISPVCCYSEPTSVSMDQVIESKFITPLINKYQQMLIADIREDIKLMDEILRLPQKALNVHNVLRARMGDLHIEFAIRRDVTNPTIQKVHSIFLDKQRHIISIINDLTNLPQNIAKVCKLFGCSNAEVMCIINIIKSNLLDKMILRLELMDWDNLNEVISIKDALDLLPNAILDSR